jgi:hypothetical protein
MATAGLRRADSESESLPGPGPGGPGTRRRPGLPGHRLGSDSRCPLDSDSPESEPELSGPVSLNLKFEQAAVGPWQGRTGA